MQEGMMGERFDRVAIVVDPNDPASLEYIVLEPQVTEDFGQGQGPKGGVMTLMRGWVAAIGAGEARLLAGRDTQGGTIPPCLILRDPQNHRAVQIAADEDSSEQSKARI
jgi:hypothetical protein